MSQITVDIETLPAPWSEAEKDAALVLARSKGQLRDGESDEDELDRIWRATALDSMRGRILCVSWAVGDEEPVVGWGHEDDDLRATFDRLVADVERAINNDSYYRQPVVWVGHRVGFDLGFLFHAAHRLRHPLANALPEDEWDKTTKPRWTRVICDTFAMWNRFHDYKDRRGRLDDIARFLGLPGKTDGVDGSQVYELWVAGEHARIAAYCARDVCVARDVWRRLAGFPEKVGIGWPSGVGPLFAREVGS